MIAIRHNSIIYYRIVVSKNETTGHEQIVLKYNAKFRYNLLSVMNVSDEIVLSDICFFKKAKKIMLNTLFELNKMMN